MRHRIAMGALIRDQKVLLAHRRADRRWYPDCWDLIGGHIEHGETPEAALRRECREEIDVVVSAMRSVEIEPSRPGIHPYAFAVTGWIGEPTNAAPDEHDELGWFAAAELSGLPLADRSYIPLLTQLLTT